MKALWLAAEWKPRPDYTPNERERTTQRAYMSDQVFYDPRVQLTDIPTPRPAAGEVVVRVKACGVCGTDVHLCEKGPDGYVAFPGHAKLPVALGHEWSGVVEEVGAGVESLRPGDRVCVEEMNWCGVCTPCRAGMVNQCVNLEEIGITVNGAFAEYVVARPQYCWKIDALVATYGDEDRAFEAGAMVEPCGVAYNAMFVRGGGFRPGGNVAIFGAGPIGLACIGLAHAAGAAKIIAFETVAERRTLAAKMGADHVYDPLALARDGRDPAGVIKELTAGVGLAMAVEAAGASRLVFPIAERCLAIGGKIVQVGMGPGQTPVTLVRIMYQGASIHGSIGHSGHDIFPAVIRLMAAGRLDMTSIVTARFPLAGAIDAIARAAERRDGKVMVKP